METASLESLLDYLQPQPYIVHSDHYSDEMETPVLTAGKTFILGKTNEKDGIFEASKEEPIILFDDFTTASQWVDFPFKVKSSACKILIPKNGVNPKYVFYAMKAINFDATSHKRYWIGTYSFSRIKFPNRFEQEKIVSELDSISNAIFKIDSGIKGCEELIKSHFVKMFGECDMSKPKAGWKRLDEIATIIAGTTPKTDIPEYWDGDIKWITPAEIPNEAFLIDDTQKHITEVGRKSCSLTIMPVGTVLFSTRAPIGKVAISDSKMCCNQGFKNFVCSDKINNAFLYQLLKMNIDWLQNQGTGTTFKEISKSSISSFLIPVPDTQKQSEFSNFLIQSYKLKSNLQREKNLLNELLGLKMHQYFD